MTSAQAPPCSTTWRSCKVSTVGVEDRRETLWLLADLWQQYSPYYDE